tara:strand:- start:64 stop:378 length:315 start_codon:yes stop_codon:yes gene_type:complete
MAKDILVTDNLNVVRSWSNGKNARNRPSTLSSINGRLISYNHKIGHRTDSGICIVADLKLKKYPDSYALKVTRSHVMLAKQFADEIFHELVSESSPLFNDEVPF